MYGNCKAGLIEISGSLYYFGEENGNRKCVTGKCLVSDGIEAGKSEYYFDTSGKGVTGIKDGSDEVSELVEPEPTVTY